MSCKSLSLSIDRMASTMASVSFTTKDTRCSLRVFSTYSCEYTGISDAALITAQRSSPIVSRRRFAPRNSEQNSGNSRREWTVSGWAELQSNCRVNDRYRSALSSGDDAQSDCQASNAWIHLSIRGSAKVRFACVARQNVMSCEKNSVGNALNSWCIRSATLVASISASNPRDVGLEPKMSVLRSVSTCEAPRLLAFVETCLKMVT